jgi:ATP-binding cassette subfamily B protein
MTDELDLELAAELDDEEIEAEKRPFNFAYFKRMLGYVRPYLKTVLKAGGLVVITTAINLAEPLINRFAIDKGIGAGSWPALRTAVLILLSFRIIAFFCGRTQIRLMNYTGQNTLYDLRRDLFNHIQTLSFQFYDGRPAGKIMSRITNDVNAMGEVVNSGMITIMNQILSLIGIIVLMLVMHWRLALLAFAMLPLLAVAILRVRPRMEHAWLRTRKTMASINGHLNETLQGLQVIQAFSRQDTNDQKFDRIIDRQLRAYMKAIRIEMFFWPLTDVLGALGIAAVTIYGAHEYFSGTLTVGMMLAFFQYMGRFWQPLSALSRMYSQISSAMASAERVFGFLDTKPLVVDKPDAVELPSIEGRVEFRDVRFAYKQDEEVLHGVSFTVEPGQTIAIVGPTGAGKSTIINLVARFYDPTGGAVIIDGHDLRDVKLQSLRSQLGIVLQDTFIFSGTIEENIRYGRLSAAAEEIEAAAKAANAHDFILQNGGYETDAKERGSALSTGQRQLLAFARAILADPRILVLDEATSSIDTETEKLIQDALRRLLADRTSFVIAHRLSTIRNADKIIVIDDGIIAEAGTHDELLRKRGIYWKLHETQVKLQEQALGEIAVAGQ